METHFEANNGVVLIVDDVPDNLSLLSAALDEAGYIVLVARDGYSALGTLQRTKPDLILLDAVMPGMDGFETCERIKQQDDYRHIPVIFMTALTESSHVLHGFEMGAIDYVTKPIRTDEVLARVSAHLRVTRHLNQVRVALESSGQAVLVVNGNGEIVWQSATASQMLERQAARDNDRSTLSTPEWAAWLRDTADTSAKKAAQPIRAQRPLGNLTVKLGARYGGNELLLYIEETTQSADSHTLAERFNLTSREAEVLAWACKGKSSRDIAQFLDMSPRTVDKHFEHIFEKLGAQSRTSAVSIALRHLGSDSSKQT